MEECEVIESDVKVIPRQEQYIQSPVDLSSTNEGIKVHKRECFNPYNILTNGKKIIFCIRIHIILFIISIEIKYRHNSNVYYY